MYFLFRKNRDKLPLYGILSVVATLCCMGVCSMSVSKNHLTAETKIRQVVNATSNRQPRLSFHVTFEDAKYLGGNRATIAKHYIDMNVAEPQTYIRQGVGNNILDDNYIVSSYQINTDDEEVPASRIALATQLSPATRLEELERVKHLLTDEEYYVKRIEILNEMSNSSEYG